VKPTKLLTKKFAQLLKVGIKPILCVGESLAQYEAGKTEAVVTDHVTGSLKDIPASASLVIAYEPVWAIGTGKAATSEQANKIIGIVRKVCSQIIRRQLCSKSAHPLRRQRYRGQYHRTDEATGNRWRSGRWGQPES